MLPEGLPGPPEPPSIFLQYAAAGGPPGPPDPLKGDPIGTPRALIHYVGIPTSWMRALGIQMGSPSGGSGEPGGPPAAAYCINIGPVPPDGGPTGTPQGFPPSQTPPNDLIIRSSSGRLSLMVRILTIRLSLPEGDVIIGSFGGSWIMWGNPHKMGEGPGSFIGVTIRGVREAGSPLGAPKN